MNFIVLPGHERIPQYAFKIRSQTIKVGIVGLELSQSPHENFDQYHPYLFELTSSTIDRFASLSKELAFSYYDSPLELGTLLPFSTLSNGLDHNDLITSHVIEVIGHYNDHFWRIFVVSTIGIGCSVWYSSIPGLISQLPIGHPIFSGSPSDLIQSSLYTGIGLVTPKNVTASVLSAFEHVYPFTEITLNSSGAGLVVDSMAMIVSFFLITGVIPPQI